MSHRNVQSRLTRSYRRYNQPMQEAVIVSAVRTPTGRFLGGLKDLSATELGALVVREAVARARIDPAGVDECIMGNVVSAGLGQAPARQAALRGGLGDRVAALTINKVCGRLGRMHDDRYHRWIPLAIPIIERRTGGYVPPSLLPIEKNANQFLMKVSEPPINDLDTFLA